MENLLLKFIFDELLHSFLSDDIIIEESLDDHGFLLSFRSFYSKQGMYFIDMVEHGFLVVERVEPEIEIVLLDEGFGLFELGVEEIDEYFGVCDDFSEEYLGVDDHDIE
jgi:hypothetical protein